MSCLRFYRLYSYGDTVGYSDLKSLEKYYLANKDTYIIQDEYENNFTFDEFLLKIDVKNEKNIKWV